MTRVLMSFLFVVCLAVTVSGQTPPASGPRPLQPGPCSANQNPLYVFSDVRLDSDPQISSYIVFTNPTKRWAFFYFSDPTPQQSAFYPHIWVAPNGRQVLPVSMTLPFLGQHSMTLGTYQWFVSVQVMTWRTLPDGSIRDVSTSPRDVFCQ